MGKEQNYDLESLMGHLGQFGKYQAFQFFLHLLAALCAGVNMVSLVTVGAVPEHRCAIPGIDVNGTMAPLNESVLELYIPRLENGEFSQCHLIDAITNETKDCKKWVYDTTHYKSSRGMEWNFVCNRRWMGAMSQALYMVGTLTGAAVLGNMADKYGRKIIFCWSAVLQLLLGVAVAFTPEIISFWVLRCLYGIFGTAGSYNPAFVLTMELVGPKFRSGCGVSFQAMFAFGIMLVAGWGALIKNRLYLQVIYGLHAISLIPHIWIMDESPRWLWGNGRAKEAVDIVQKALKMNGKKVELDTAAYVSKANSEKRTKEEEADLSSLIKFKRLRLRTLNICLGWFANSIAYYGLSLNTNALKGNPYLILFLMGIVEIPGYIITVYLMDRIGRRILTAFCMIWAAIFCIVASILTKGSTESLSLAILGKFLIASSFAIIYNYSAELFPTCIRNSAMGIAAMCARFSGAITPFIFLLDSIGDAVPSITFGAIALISGCCILFLPETNNQPMPETIQDGENFGVGDTFFTQICGKKKKDKEAESGLPEGQPLKDMSSQ